MYRGGPEMTPNHERCLEDIDEAHPAMGALAACHVRAARERVDCFRQHDNECSPNDFSVCEGRYEGAYRDCPDPCLPFDGAELSACELARGDWQGDLFACMFVR
jgi:hypothetical protein